MKVVAILASKGGAGKTTTTLTVATAAAEMGLSVRILDVDPQATATRWSDRRGREPTVRSIQAARLTASLEEARADGIDLVLIDTSPRADTDALAAARACDLALLPCPPAIADLEALQTTIDLVSVARKEQAAYVLLNAVPARGTEAAETEEVVQGMGATLAPVRLGYRKEFRRSQLTGEGVVETEPGGKAAAEARALAEWTVKKLGLTSRRRRKKVA